MSEVESRILIVDDDLRLRTLLERYFQEQGYSVRSAADAKQMDRLLTRESFSLMVLDLMLPGEDGISICQRLRKKGNEIPIIMLTAKGDEMDRIYGLEMGADDYLAKPFNPRELAARIKAVLKRHQKDMIGSSGETFKDYHFGRFRFDINRRELYADGKMLPLTSGEYEVLKALVMHEKEPLSRDKLMNFIRGRDYSALERSIDVQISRLRRMIEDDPTKPRFIQTVWGLGYVFIPDTDEAS
ncbi:two-component system response regulator OmpR [Aliidiomarina iranensis]|uniref:Two-component system response regulator OmpR n=1 Tax=Aliidiomarina iranensis TaxID=1434071 RepID=A0A432W2G2_9GAMM|nr:two-component system response regulator OmpR [Aliidiomarina iranensis]RUO23405.1 two-component system response regulator OmpR [Aliidiomarina iranensis]